MSTTVARMVTEASATIPSLSPETVEALAYAGEAVMLDVRERDELQEHGWIAASVHVPRGLLEFAADPSSPGHRPELDVDTCVVVCCPSGRRSALAAATLVELGYRDVRILAGGIEAWKARGLPVAGLASWHHAPAATADLLL